jgi:hypothetical protein
MALFTQPVQQAKALKAIVDQNAGIWGVSAVYYGDQQQIAVTPTICIDSGPKRKVLNGAPRKVLIVLETYVMIYHVMVGKSEEIRLSNDEFVEQVEEALERDGQLKDNLNHPQLVHGYCIAVEPGYARRGSALYRATRITYEGTSQEQLPPAQ